MKNMFLHDAKKLRRQSLLSGRLGRFGLQSSWRGAMARRQSRTPDRERVFRPLRRLCPACGGEMRIRYENRRTLVTLSGTVRVRLKVRRCEAKDCARYHRPYRPEAEGALALPEHEFGLDVIALVGRLRHCGHRSVPEIHAVLRERGVSIAERSVTNLLDRYDELLATALTDSTRLRGLLAKQGRIILGLDGLQLDVGHEVLWVLRDCLSGTVLLARSLLSSTASDLAALLHEVVDAVGVPVAGVVSDGQHSIRKAVRQAFAGRASPTLPVPFPARGRPSGLRSRSACQEGVEEAGA